MRAGCVVLLVALCVASSSGRKKLVSISFYGEKVTRMSEGPVGTVADPGQFPSMVSIRDETKTHICGGSLIAVNYVLTAAHCVYDEDLSGYTIYTGTNSLLRGGKSYYIKSMMVHNAFNNVSMANDLAILRTIKEVKLDAYTNVAELPSRKIRVPTGAQVTVVGWDLYELTPERKGAGKSAVIRNLRPQDALPFLRYLPGIIVENRKCAFNTFEAIDTNYCAIGARGKDVCIGDAGGPMMYKGYMVGVVLVGPSCAINLPSLFVKTSSFLAWINYAKFSLDILAEQETFLQKLFSIMTYY